MLLLSGSILFGTASDYNGVFPSSGSGNVFAINTDGSDFRVLYSFTPVDAAGANTDGAYPLSGLLLLGNRLSATTAYGGSPGQGTVFSVNTDGTGFALLHSFADNGGRFPASPRAGLVFSGKALCGNSALGRLSTAPMRALSITIDWRLVTQRHDPLTEGLGIGRHGSPGSSYVRIS